MAPTGGDSHLHLAGRAGPRPPIVEPRPELGNMVNQLWASDAQVTRGGDVISQSKRAWHSQCDVLRLRQGRGLRLIGGACSHRWGYCSPLPRSEGRGGAASVFRGLPRRLFRATRLRRGGWRELPSTGLPVPLEQVLSLPDRAVHTLLARRGLAAKFPGLRSLR